MQIFRFLQRKKKPTKSNEPLNIFCSYAPEDEALFKKLEKHLSILRRQKAFVIWTRGKISPGEETEREIIRQMKEAYIILLLLSPEFVASDTIWALEWEEAIKKQQNKKGIVIPVLLRPFDWESIENLPTSLHDQRVLPKDAIPVTSWPNQDVAFTDIASNIRKIANHYEKTHTVSWKPLGTGISLAVAVSMLAASAVLVPGSNETPPQHTVTKTHVPAHPLSPVKPQRVSFNPLKGVSGWSLGIIGALITVLAILILILNSMRATPPPPTRVAPPPVAAATATVTITPASQQVSNTFTIPATTDTPDSQQVQARMISAITPTVSHSVKTTGKGMTPATSARGTVKMSNYSSVPVTITAGTSYPCNYDDDGACPGVIASLDLIVDQTVTLPAYSSPDHQVSGIPAHIQQGGTNGNFSSRCSGYYCFGFDNDALTIVNESAFTGGTNSQPYSFVQQSDIDNEANMLISENNPSVQQAQQLLQPYIQANERTIGTPLCMSNTTKADHPVGAHRTKVTVSVNFKCTGEVYDYAGALSLAAQLLKKQADTSPGSAYGLIGQIVPSMQSASLTGQLVTLLVAAKGIWVYQITAAQQQAWVKLIVGQHLQAAKTRLASQQGVAQVTIQLTGTHTQMLPKDEKRINVVIASVHGL